MLEVKYFWHLSASLAQKYLAAIGHKVNTDLKPLSQSKCIKQPPSSFTQDRSFQFLPSHRPPVFFSSHFLWFSNVSHVAAWLGASPFDKEVKTNGKACYMLKSTLALVPIWRPVIWIVVRESLYIKLNNRKHESTYLSMVGISKFSWSSTDLLLAVKFSIC